MSRYRRARVPGGTYFFTVVTERRQPCKAGETRAVVGNSIGNGGFHPPYRMPRLCAGRLHFGSFIIDVLAGRHWTMAGFTPLPSIWRPHCPYNKDVVMSRYRRARVPGGTYFFTVVTERRQPILTHADVRLAL